MITVHGMMMLGNTDAWPVSLSELLMWLAFVLAVLGVSACAVLLCRR